MIRMSALVGQRQHTLRFDSLHDARKCSECGWQSSIQKLVDQRSLRLLRQEYNLMHANRNQRCPRLRFSNRGIAFARAKSSPEVSVLRSAIGGKHNAWISHALQQTAAGDGLVIWMRNDDQRATQKWS